MWYSVLWNKYFNLMLTFTTPSFWYKFINYILINAFLLYLVTLSVCIIIVLASFESLFFSLKYTSWLLFVSASAEILFLWKWVTRTALLMGSCENLYKKYECFSKLPEITPPWVTKNDISILCNYMTLCDWASFSSFFIYYFHMTSSLLII